MSKEQFTIKEHFISKFILDYFRNGEDMISFVNKKDLSVIYDTKPKDIMFQKHLYEFKNLDGSYYARNAIENYFANMEGEMSRILNSNWHDVENKGFFEGIFYWLYGFYAIRDFRIRNKILLHFKNFYTIDTLSSDEEFVLENALYMRVLADNKFVDGYLRANNCSFLQKFFVDVFGDKKFIEDILFESSSRYGVIFLETESDEFFIGDKAILNDLELAVHDSNNNVYYLIGNLMIFHPKLAVYFYPVELFIELAMTSLDKVLWVKTNELIMTKVNYRTFELADENIVSTFKSRKKLQEKILEWSM